MDDEAPPGADENRPRRPKTLLERLKRKFAGGLFRGASLSLIINLGGMALAVATGAILARVLGAESYARYVYVFATMDILAVFARLGLDTSALRYVAAYHSQGKLGMLRGFLSWSWRVGLLASAVTATLLASGVWIFREKIGDPELVTSLYVLAVLIPINARLQISNAALLAFKEVVRARAPGMLVRPVVVVAIVVVLVYGLHQKVDTTEAMWISVASFTLLTIVNGLFLRNALPKGLGKVPAERESKEWMTTTLPLLALSALQSLNNRIDIQLLGILGDVTEAGIYTVSTRLVRLIGIGLMAVNQVFPAMVSELYSAGKIKELQRLAVFASRIVGAFTVPVGLILIFGGKYILGIYGEEFVAGYPSLAILAVGQIINALCGSVGFLLAITGHQKTAVKILIASLGLTVLFNVILVPLFGMLGAAIGTTLAMVTWNITMVIAVHRKLGIHSTALGTLFARKKRGETGP